MESDNTRTFLGDSDLYAFKDGVVGQRPFDVQALGWTGFLRLHCHSDVPSQVLPHTGVAGIHITTLDSTGHHDLVGVDDVLADLLRGSALLYIRIVEPG